MDTSASTYRLPTWLAPINMHTQNHVLAKLGGFFLGKPMAAVLERSNAQILEPQVSLWTIIIQLSQSQNHDHNRVVRSFACLSWSFFLQEVPHQECKDYMNSQWSAGTGSYVAVLLGRQTLAGRGIEHWGVYCRLGSLHQGVRLPLSYTAVPQLSTGLDLGLWRW